MARISKVDGIRIQRHEPRANRQPGWVRRHQIDEFFQLVGFWKWDAVFLKQRLQVFLDALLGMKTPVIVIGVFAGAQFTQRAAVVLFGFFDPLLGEGTHKSPSRAQ